ncbi:hypothetical protein M405DRAFT_201143 [Rhizopogon salebrosus TDB-379]|nr:hypothetical protein M405DRAFT_201143 [Rhizopogon salebrosus TDB-379]
MQTIRWALCILVVNSYPSTMSLYAWYRYPKSPVTYAPHIKATEHRYWKATTQSVTNQRSMPRNITATFIPIDQISFCSTYRLCLVVGKHTVML